MKLTEKQRDAAMQAITNAKKAHKTWVARADAILNGVTVEAEHNPMLPTQCAFGEWYYGAGQAFMALPDFRQIEEPHDALHTTYMKIFSHVTKEKPEPSLWGKFFGKGDSSKVDAEESKKLYEALHGYSNDVVYHLDVLKEKIANMAVA